MRRSRYHVFRPTNGRLHFLLTGSPGQNLAKLSRTLQRSKASMPILRNTQGKVRLSSELAFSTAYDPRGEHSNTVSHHRRVQQQVRVTDRGHESGSHPAKIAYERAYQDMLPNITSEISFMFCKLSVYVYNNDFNPGSPQQNHHELPKSVDGGGYS